MYIILRCIYNNKAHKLGSELYSSHVTDKAIYLFFHVNIETTSLHQMGENLINHHIATL